MLLPAETRSREGRIVGVRRFAERGRVLPRILQIVLVLVLLVVVAPPARPAAAEGNFKLPTKPGVGISVSQGNNAIGMGSTHTAGSTNAWAFDFLLAEGSEVYASRAGYVRLVRENSNVGGCGEQYANDANYIVIDHQDGSASLYLHLKLNGALVNANAFVEQGQLIGLSGATGHACGAHLHFAVQDYIPGQWFTQSRPVIFADHNHPDDNGIPPGGIGGRTVFSRNWGLEAAKDWFLAE
jgi:murein DD-endopeptidase MepM/ murein hydrolase activator NlpD